MINLQNISEYSLRNKITATMALMVQTKIRLLITLLVVMHAAGLIGMNIPTLRDWVLPLTPINLIGTSIILFYFQRDLSTQFWIFTITCFLGGFAVEALGVHTGAVFGGYKYGTVLGVQLWDVPVIIGLNWLILIYSIGIIVSQLKADKWFKALLCATLMVGIDVLIEPVAMGFNFWQWQDGIVPLRNYTSWWLVSFILASLFMHLKFSKINPMALPVFLTQIVFFLMHCLLIAYW